MFYTAKDENEVEIICKMVMNKATGIFDITPNLSDVHPVSDAAKEKIDTLFIQSIMNKVLFENFSDYLLKYIFLGDQEPVISDNALDASANMSLITFVIKRLLALSRKGNDKAKEIMLMIIKDSFPVLYRQLKKINRVDQKVLKILYDQELYGAQNQFIVIVLTVAELLKITLDYSVAFYYQIMVEIYDETIDKMKPVKERDFDISGSMLEIVAYNQSVGTPFLKTKNYKTSRIAYRFLDELFDYQNVINNQQFSHGQNYLFLPWIKRVQDLEDNMILAHAILKKIYPNREFTMEQIQLYGILASCARMFYYTNEVSRRNLNVLTEAGCKLVRFNISGPEYTEQNKNKENITHERERELNKRIKELETKLSQKSSDYEHLSGLYEKEKKENRQKAERIKELEKENLKLREVLLYDSDSNTQSDSCQIENTTAYSQEELKMMIDYIAPRKVMIVGGHPNWLYKLRNQFPNWTIIDPEGSKVASEKKIRQMEVVYFYEQTLAHKCYGRCISQTRKFNIPTDYIKNINFDLIIPQIYLDLVDIDTTKRKE